MKLNLKKLFTIGAAVVLFTSCQEQAEVKPTSVEQTSTANGLGDVITSDDIIRVDYGTVKGYKLTLPRYFENGTGKSFFSTSIGQKYSMTAVKNLNLYSKIDFFCTYDNGMSRIMAPFAYNNYVGVFGYGKTNRRTNFSFTTLKVSDLSKAVKSPQFIKDNFHIYESPYTQLPLSENNIYAFKTDSDIHGAYYGLIRVLDIKIESITIEVFVNEIPL